MTSTTSTPTRPSRVLAFDPGFERLGVAVVERAGSKENLVYSNCVRTKSSLPLHERLHVLSTEVQKLLAAYTPDAVAIEKIYFVKNQKTAMQVAQVVGVLSELSAAEKLPLFEYTPAEVKVAVTGNGASDKHAVAHMVGKLIALPEKKRLDDEIDAIAIALTCLASARV